MANNNTRHNIRSEMANRAQAWGAPGEQPQHAPSTAPTGHNQRGGGHHHQHHHQQQIGGSLPNGLNVSIGTDEYSRAVAAAAKGGASAGAGGGQLQALAPNNNEFGGMEGPLPSEARAIIYQNCAGETAEQAEVYARRLLSTHRRVRVYKEELSAAVEEVQDMNDCLEKSSLVQTALSHELNDLDARIAALQRERELVQHQTDQEQHNSGRYASKHGEAKQRVDVLRTTIDSIAKDTQRGQMMLQQLVPNLQIDNYC